MALWNFGFQLHARSKQFTPHTEHLLVAATVGVVQLSSAPPPFKPHVDIILLAQLRDPRDFKHHCGPILEAHEGCCSIFHRVRAFLHRGNERADILIFWFGNACENRAHHRRRLGEIEHPQPQIKHHQPNIPKRPATRLGFAGEPTTQLCGVCATQPSRFEIIDVPKRTLLNHQFERPRIVAKTVVHPHKQDSVVRAGGFDHFLRPLRCQRHRLFHEHMHARFQATNGNRSVQVIGRTDTHSVKVGMLEHIAEVGVHLRDAKTIGDIPRTTPVDIAQRHQLHFGDTQVVGDMAMHFVSSNGTDTNDTYTQLSRTHRLTSPSCFL